MSVDVRSHLRALYFKIREPIRLNPYVGKSIYLVQSLVHSNTGDFRKKVLEARRNAPKGDGVAVCVRIRDEGKYLKEFLDYYLAAGVSHFFLYESFSTDNFREILAPYIEREEVTLCADWPHIPVSPTAEQDCILRSVGRFKWVGFLDADEFVVVKDGRTIDAFLAGYAQHPAVALHWWMYGTSGYETDAPGSVISSYRRRHASPNRHVKCFVQPSCIAKFRNPHSWYYLGMRFAVNELGRRVLGSISQPPTAELAWVNHYHFKSRADYLRKAKRKSVMDENGMKFAYRTEERFRAAEQATNAVEDDSALAYYCLRSQLVGDVK